MNRRLKKQTKGFTLMEILIATAIFAAVMILVTGIVAQASGFKSKIEYERRSSEEVKRVSDMITRDVRSANASVKFSLSQGGTGEFDSGVAILNAYYDGTETYFLFTDMGTPSDYTTLPNSNATHANVLVVATKDVYKVYLASRSYYAIYYKTFPRLDANGAVYTLTDADILSTRDDGSAALNRITDLNTTAAADFAGYAPQDSLAAKKQPYVQFYITSKSSNYSGSIPQNRGMAEIRSTVTVRDYPS